MSNHAELIAENDIRNTDVHIIKQVLLDKGNKDESIEFYNIFHIFLEARLKDLLFPFIRSFSGSNKFQISEEIAQLNEGNLTSTSAETTKFSNLFKEPKTRVLIYCDKPEISLANNLKSGMSEEDVILSWQLEVRALLSLYNQNKDRCLMLDVVSVLSDPKGFLSRLQNWLGIDEISAGRIMLSDQIEEPKSCLYTLIANEIIRQKEALRILSLEFKESFWPKAGMSLEVKYNDLLNELKELEKQKQMQSSDLQEGGERLISQHEDDSILNSELVEENELLQLQLHQVQLELEAYYEKAQNNEKQLKIEKEMLSKHLKELEFRNQEFQKVTLDRNNLKQQKEELKQQVKYFQRQYLKYKKEAKNKNVVNDNDQEGNLALEMTSSKEKKTKDSSSKIGLVKNQEIDRNLLKELMAYTLTESQNIIRKSSFFDENWYLNEYSDVKQSNMDPVVHFLLIGANELKNPNSDFNTKHYLEQYPELKEANINPIVYHTLLQER